MDRYNTEKLNSLLRKERLRSIFPFAIAGALILAVFGFLYYDTGEFNQVVLRGTVESWSRQQDYIGSGVYIIWVTLDDGSKVLATGSRIGRAPLNGETISVVKSQTTAGTVRYRWNR